MTASSLNHRSAAEVRLLNEYLDFLVEVGQRLRAWAPPSIFGFQPPTAASFWSVSELPEQHCSGYEVTDAQAALDVVEAMEIGSMHSSLVSESATGCMVGKERWSTRHLVWDAHGSFRVYQFRADKVVQVDGGARAECAVSPVVMSDRPVRLFDMPILAWGRRPPQSVVRGGVRIFKDDCARRMEFAEVPMCCLAVDVVLKVLELKRDDHPMDCPCALDIFRPTCPWVEARLASG